MNTTAALPQMPTVEGKAEGIVSLDPLTLQCRDCGVTTEQPADRGIALFVILSGFHFHTCEGPTGVRRCPPCLEVVRSACPRGACR